MMSARLMERKIKHIREYVLPNSNYMIDFYFQNEELAVELD